ncbi:hypothetical protein R1flu_003481 [Riccia fluitans]|uniref:Transposase n=1 Tax=Riccia fluitans TaxID=41844 RepID=A0ABD1Y966_9MARC
MSGLSVPAFSSWRSKFQTKDDLVLASFPAVQRFQMENIGTLFSALLEKLPRQLIAPIDTWHANTAKHVQPGQVTGLAHREFLPADVRRRQESG